LSAATAPEPALLVVSVPAPLPLAAPPAPAVPDAPAAPPAPPAPEALPLPEAEPAPLSAFFFQPAPAARPRLMNAIPIVRSFAMRLFYYEPEQAGSRPRWVRRCRRARRC
jgi:hypothetical protein